VFGTETGVLRVSYRRQTQLTYAHGVGRVRTESDPTFMTSIQLIGAALGLDQPQWYRPRALLALAEALLRAGRGGCLLVSRRPREEIRRGRIRVTFPTAEPLTTLADADLEAQVAAPPTSPHAALFEKFAARDRKADIRRSAQLGAVDGAILLDEHLRIAGFGAMIDVRGMRNGGRVYVLDKAGAVPELADAPDSLAGISARAEAPLADLGGQRHQSAIRWCSSSRAALLAIVCSQDGPTALVTPGNAGDAVVVPNLETSPDGW
jgi:hypothetical protein